MGTRAGREMQGGGRKTMKVEKKAKGVRNVHNLGVDVTDIQQKPVVFDKRSIQRLSPSSATPTTPQTPISPFVDALWTNLNEQQKESTLYLNEHLTQASWILLRRRAICLFKARAMTAVAKARRKMQLMAEVVARKEREIEQMMRNESSDDAVEEVPPTNSRRSLPRQQRPETPSPSSGNAAITEVPPALDLMGSCTPEQSPKSHKRRRRTASSA